RRWNEHKLETALYGTNDRAHEFWRQADRALHQPTTEALEAFYWCVQLGFRGERRHDPVGLAAWRDRARRKIAARLRPPPAWPDVAPESVRPSARPLGGRGRFERAVRRAVLLVFLVVLPLLACATTLRLCGD